MNEELTTRMKFFSIETQVLAEVVNRWSLRVLAWKNSAPDLSSSAAV